MQNNINYQKTIKTAPKATRTADKHVKKVRQWKRHDKRETIQGDANTQD